jgi:hypothetical protein
MFRIAAMDEFGRTLKRRPCIQSALCAGNYLPELSIIWPNLPKNILKVGNFRVFITSLFRRIVASWSPRRILFNLLKNVGLLIISQGWVLNVVLNWTPI